jgi:hypothetical protein
MGREERFRRDTLVTHETDAVHFELFAPDDLLISDESL